MTKSGEKMEEYRDITLYWVSRLCNSHPSCIGGEFMDEHYVKAYTFKSFTKAELRNGYGKKVPRHYKIIESITIGTGRPEWGAEPGKLYFVIKYKH